MNTMYESKIRFSRRVDSQQQCLLSADQRLAFPSDKVISCFCFRRRATYRTVLLTEWTYLRFLQSDYRI